MSLTSFFKDTWENMQRPTAALVFAAGLSAVPLEVRTYGEGGVQVPVAEAQDKGKKMSPFQLENLNATPAIHAYLKKRLADKDKGIMEFTGAFRNLPKAHNANPKIEVGPIVLRKADLPASVWSGFKLPSNIASVEVYLSRRPVIDDKGVVKKNADKNHYKFFFRGPAPSGSPNGPLLCEITVPQNKENTYTPEEEEDDKVIK